MKIYKASAWESASGRWFVNYTDDLASDYGKWWVPMRILDLAPENFILLLKDKFKAKHFTYNKDTDTLIYSWDYYEDAHKWTLYLNKIAKQKRIMV